MVFSSGVMAEPFSIFRTAEVDFSNTFITGWLSGGYKTISHLLAFGLQKLRKHHAKAKKTQCES